MEMIVMYTT